MAVGHLWAAFSRDSGYQLTGGLPIRSLKAVVRHVGVDTCELTTPYTPEAYGRLAPGCGIVATRDGAQQFSGMVGAGRRIEYDGSTGAAFITVQALGDDVHLADRLVYPSPALDPTAQTADYWTFTGPASSAMWALIAQQAGPQAQAARRVPTLVMGADPGVGVSRLWSSQFDNLAATLEAWSVLSTVDVGVRLVSTADGLRADLYVPRDVSAGVRFSASLTNLLGWTFEQAPPSVTYAVCAGQGDLHLRTRRVAQTSNAGDLAWGRRIEQLVDSRDEADTTKLQQNAVDAIVTGTGTAAVTLKARDTLAARYGVDWTLGDRVTVHIGLPGGTTAATVTDLVREVALSVDERGRETITPAVGTNDAKAMQPGPTQAALADVAAGLARLTRNK